MHRELYAVVTKHTKHTKKAEIYLFKVTLQKKAPSYTAKTDVSRIPSSKQLKF